MKKRACSRSGCPNAAVTKGLCEKCGERRPVEGKVYGTRHKMLRIEAFIRDGWKCEKCLWIPEIARRALEIEALFKIPVDADKLIPFLTADYKAGRRHLQADHIMPVEERPDLAHVLANYRTLCSHCHRRGI